MKCVSSSTSIALLLVAASAIHTTQALKAYLSNLPNGALFTQPLGHPNSDETQFTDFATAFAAVDKTWTTEFCKATFPGSTMTNGAAFGDPCCTWKKGDTAPQTVTAFTTTPTKATTCATAETPAPAATTATPAATTATPAATTATPATTTAAPETDAPETDAPETETPATLTSAPAASSESDSSSSTTTSAPSAAASSAKPSSSGGSAYSPGKVSPPTDQKGQFGGKRPGHGHGGQGGAQAFGARGGNNSTASAATEGKGNGMGSGKQQKFGRSSAGSTMKPAASQTPTATT